MTSLYNIPVRKEGLASSVDAQGHDADVSAALGQSGDGVSHSEQHIMWLHLFVHFAAIPVFVPGRHQRSKKY